MKCRICGNLTALKDASEDGQIHTEKYECPRGHVGRIEIPVNENGFHQHRKSKKFGCISEQHGDQL